MPPSFETFEVIANGKPIQVPRYVYVKGQPMSADQAEAEHAAFAAIAEAMGPIAAMERQPGDEAAMPDRRSRSEKEQDWDFGKEASRIVEEQKAKAQAYQQQPRLSDGRRQASEQLAITEAAARSENRARGGT